MKMDPAIPEERDIVADQIDVGGLSEFAAGNRAKIIRKAADGRQQEIKVRLQDLLEDGDLSQNIAVQPGDVLIIPESRF